MTPFKVFAASAVGTEAALLSETTRLGLSMSQARGGATATLSLREAYRLCLWSRTATRVIATVAEGSVSSADDLYTLAKAIPWEEQFSPTSSFLIGVAGRHRAFSNDRFAVQRCKDAIVDRFRERGQSRPSVDRQRPEIRIALFLGNPCSIGVELASGMHRRGYRAGARAPLRESLAAALLELAGFDGSRPLVDPFCGSGTILLEASLRQATIAPGLLREPAGPCHWLFHDAGLWRELWQEAQELRQTPKAGLLFGSDIDPNAVAETEHAAAKLGLQKSLSLKVAAIERAPVPEAFGGAESARDVLPGGLIVTNPPYGKRLGQERELIPLFARIGDTLKQRFGGFTAWLLLGNPALGKHIGLRAEQRIPLFNGAIECRFSKYPIFSPKFSGAPEAKAAAGTSPDPESPSAEVRSHGAPSPRLDAESRMFQNRLRKNQRRLAPWRKQRQLEAYRLYDCDIPEFNLRVEVYGERVRVEEIAPPKHVPGHLADKRLKNALRIVAAQLSIAPEDISLRVRAPRAGDEQEEARGQQSARFTVSEGPTRFEINLDDYLDTGLYLEDRLLRDLVRKGSNSRTVLNLFAYTCSASVAAAVGGAKQVTSVDSSRSYLDWGEANFRANQIDPALHRFELADALSWLHEAAQDRYRYDLIYCGPPTFSRASGRRDFDVSRDHRELIELCRSVLRPAGDLLFFTHKRGFALSPALRPHADELSEALRPRDTPRSQLAVFRFSASKHRP